MPGFEPGAAGWEARILPLCYAAPTNEESYKMYFFLGLEPWQTI